MDDSVKKLICELVEYTENGDIQWEAKDGMMVCGSITFGVWQEDPAFFVLSAGLPLYIPEADAIPLLVAMVRAELMWKKTPDMKPGDVAYLDSAYSISGSKTDNPIGIATGIYGSTATVRPTGW